MAETSNAEPFFCARRCVELGSLAAGSALPLWHAVPNTGSARSGRCSLWDWLKASGPTEPWPLGMLAVYIHSMAGGAASCLPLSGLLSVACGTPFGCLLHVCIARCYLQILIAIGSDLSADAEAADSSDCLNVGKLIHVRACACACSRVCAYRRRVLLCRFCSSTSFG